MATAVRPQDAAPREEAPATTHLTSEQVWKELDKASFAVIAYVTPNGEPRSSGVVYKTVGRKLYTVVAAGGWKARHIASGNRVAVTVPVHRGGVLALAVPIPPATISFHATAVVHEAASVKIADVSKELEALLPPGRGDAGVLIEMVPEGRFVVYGLGVSLIDMAKPDVARAVVPISS